MKKIRPKKCKVCKTKFQPERPFQPCCCVKCAIAYVNAQKMKLQRKEDAKTRARLKTRGMWLREAQGAFNKYTRLRDKDYPCISCGNYHQGQYHAGHFYTTAARPDLRFNEDNCHKQCSVCNNHKSGNIHEYRPNLIEKIGQDRVDALEVVGRSDWSIEEIKEIKQEYKEKYKYFKESEKFYKSMIVPF